MDSKANVLVVDDDASIRESLRRILGKQGYGVDTASTAEEALVALPEKPFDLVLTDLQMPGMDGLELLDELKRRSPQTPVVMITAHAMTETVIQALRRGVSDFVTKPYKPDELLIIVERETSQRKPLESPGDLAEAPAVLGRQLSTRQLDEIDRILAELRAETAARCVLMVEGTGHVIDAKGVIEDINISALAALVAGDFAATAGIASLIGEGASFRLNYHEGAKYSVYSAQVTFDVFLLIIFGQEVKSGMVLYAAKQAFPALQKLIEQAPTAPRPAAPSMPESPEFAPPAMLDAEPGELFTFDEILGSGLLGDDALDTLDDQFKSLWN